MVPTDGPTLAVALKRFEKPDEVRRFARGRFELVTMGGMTIGRATYEPGWRWSVDVGPTVGSRRALLRPLFLGIVALGLARSDWAARYVARTAKQ